MTDNVTYWLEQYTSHCRWLRGLSVPEESIETIALNYVALQRERVADVRRLLNVICDASFEIAICPLPDDGDNASKIRGQILNTRNALAIALNRHNKEQQNLRVAVPVRFETVTVDQISEPL